MGDADIKTAQNRIVQLLQFVNSKEEQHDNNAKSVHKLILRKDIEVKQLLHLCQYELLIVTSFRLSLGTLSH
jgi:hypothetical protein